jgi:hypothetical protein
LPKDGIIGVAHQNKAGSWDCVFVGITRAGQAFSANLLRQTYYFDHAPCAASENGPRRHTVRATDKQPTLYLLDGTEVLRDSLRSNVSVFSNTLVRPLLQIDAALSARLVGTLNKEWLDEKLKVRQPDGRLDSPNPTGKVSPEIQKRFQGRVESYDTETRMATVAYDFAEASQLRDFLPPAPNSFMHREGRLTLNCGAAGDWPLRMENFRRHNLSLRLDYRLEKPFDERHFLAIRFGVPGQPHANSPTVSFVADQNGAAFVEGGPLAYKTKRRVMAEVKTAWPANGSLVVGWRLGQLTAELDGKPLLKHPVPGGKRSELLSVGGGGGCRYVVERLAITGPVKNKFIGSAIAASGKQEDDDD